MVRSRVLGLVLLAVLLGAAGCGDDLTDDERLDLQCSDGVKDGEETDVDCGGPCARKCVSGAACRKAADCAAANCAGGVCVEVSCSDGMKDGDESDVDCGGSCPPCATGGACARHADCEMSACVDGSCAEPSCDDGARNGDERDADCGGPCPPCALGRNCGADADCASSMCVQGTCSQPSCTDGEKNGSESDVDCGGACATKCAVGRSCNAGGDCATRGCKAGVCIESGCGDGTKNGGESDVDCGDVAGVCPRCGQKQACAADASCSAGKCVKGRCYIDEKCFDGVETPTLTESDVDCGGWFCPRCADGKKCVAEWDCESNICQGGVCQKLTPCNNQTRDPGESDVDCGDAAGTCPRCADGKGCLDRGSCASGFCSGGTCYAASCGNMKMDGAETDRDCGGSCPGCANGLRCQVKGDCASAYCEGSLCKPIPPCINGKLDAGESDVDCGGACASCGVGKKCARAADCVTDSCVGGKCVETCNDGLKGASEVDIDCGGPCPPCPVGADCKKDADCACGKCGSPLATDPPRCLTACPSGEPTSFPTPACANGRKDPGEGDVDCGGPCRATCGLGETCGAAADCAGGACAAGRCAATCTDGEVDGAETDFDCGGGCPKCRLGQACKVAADCLSGACRGQRCETATCVDGKKDGKESDVDCGGDCVAGCAVGKACAIGRDCASRICAAGRCAAGKFTFENTALTGGPGDWQRIGYSYVSEELAATPLGELLHGEAWTSGNSAVRYLYLDGGGPVSQHRWMRQDLARRASLLVDQDGDGRLDVLFATHGVLWLLKPSLNAPRRWAALPSSGGGLASPTGMVFIDVNGDGRADLVTNNEADHRFGFHAGSGAGALAAPVTTSASWGRGLAAADVDGDGKTDLATWDARGVHVWKGDGKGGFAFARFLPTGGQVSSVQIADLDGDGAKDLLAVASSTMVFLGGGGRLVPYTRLSYSPQPVVDVDGDRVPDFGIGVGANSSTGVCAATLHLGDGRGGMVSVPAERRGPSTSTADYCGTNLVLQRLLDLTGDGVAEYVEYCDVSSLNLSGRGGAYRLTFKRTSP